MDLRSGSPPRLSGCFVSTTQETKNRKSSSACDGRIDCAGPAATTEVRRVSAVKHLHIPRITQCIRFPPPNRCNSHQRLPPHRLHISKDCTSQSKLKLGKKGTSEVLGFIKSQSPIATAKLPNHRGTVLSTPFSTLTTYTIIIIIIPTLKAKHSTPARPQTRRNPHSSTHPTFPAW